MTCTKSSPTGMLVTNAEDSTPALLSIIPVLTDVSCPILVTACVTPRTCASLASSVRMVGIFSMVDTPRRVTISRFSFSKPSDLLATYRICADISSVQAITAAEIVNCTSTRTSRRRRLPLPARCLPVKADSGAQDER